MSEHWIYIYYSYIQIKFENLYMVNCYIWAGFPAVSVAVGLAERQQQYKSDR
jgi:hypothetical protein